MFKTKDSDETAMRLYLSIMEEVKVRALSINTATKQPNELPIFLIREYCFLQLRILCELIALGCLVAHGDLEEIKTKKLQKAYQPDEIIKRLTNLHPDFYPIPVKMIIGDNSIHLDEINNGYLTKERLITLYGKCGDLLHKGNLKKIIEQSVPDKRDFQDINEWGQKILNLLSVHRVSRVGGNIHFLTLLENSEGKVQVAIGQHHNGTDPKI